MSLKHDYDGEDWCPKCDTHFIEPFTCKCFPTTKHPKGQKPLDRALKELHKPKETKMSETKDLTVKANHEIARTESITWTQEQTQLIKDTICKGATDSELKLFLHVSQKTGLDPFVRQIYSIGRWDSRLGREIQQTQISIDGARLVAERSGKYKGQLGPFWCGDDGVWKDVWLDPKNPPRASKVGIIKDGFDEPLWGTATWDQYVQTDKNGNPTHMWKKLGPVMIAKCAEMLGLRKAFPQDLSGLYSAEEMDQASSGQDENFDKRSAGNKDPNATTPGNKTPPPGDKKKEEPKQKAADKKKDDIPDAQVVDDKKKDEPKKPTPEETVIQTILAQSKEATDGMNDTDKKKFMAEFWGAGGLPALKKKALGELKDITKTIQKHLDKKKEEAPLPSDSDIPGEEDFKFEEN